MSPGSKTDNPFVEVEWNELTSDEKDEFLFNQLARERGKRAQVLEPKLESVQNDNRELRQENEELRQQLHEVRAEYESLGELGEEMQSTPQKRVADLRKLLINKAKVDYESGGGGMVAWRYDTVIDQLEANGHGKVWPAQAHTAMEDAGKAEGFGFGTDHDDVKVVRVNYTELTVHDAVNDINNEEGVSPPDQIAVSD